MLRIFALLSLFLFSTSIFATERIVKDHQAHEIIPGASLVRYTDLSSLPNYIKFRADAFLPLESFGKWTSVFFNLNQDYGFNEMNRTDDKLGYTHIRLQQTYKGLPIQGSMLILHAKNQAVESMSGVFFEHVNSNPIPSISETQALQNALMKVNAQTYKWQIPAEENMIKNENGDANATFYPKSKQVILRFNNTFYTCFSFDIYAHEPMGRTIEYVDAQSGEVILSKNMIQDVNVNATAITKYSGTKIMQTDSTAPGSYILRDASRGLGVQTFDLNMATTYGGAVDFTDADNYWNNVNAQQDEAASDAHWGAQKTYDYLFNIHGRNSIDNAGFALKSYVHYGNGYNNAFWDGTRMTYGDGIITSGFLIFTALDVCGHEIGHGLVNYSCDLSAASTGTQECDALNEAYSDYIGTSVERNARPTQWDWRIGGDFTCNSLGVPNGLGLRSMQNPLLFSDPNCYQGSNWSTAGQPHTNAGPFDYWFYTMVTGNTASSITGLGFDTSDNITYRTLTVHLFPSADYADARFYSIVSSTELYGGCSQATITTTNAWNKVCVGAAYVPGPADANFTTNITQTCDTTLTVAFTNTSTNINTCVWDFGDGATSTQYNTSHTYSAGTYSVKLTVYGGTCGNDSITQVNYIQVGPPSAPITIHDTLCSPGSATLMATPSNPSDTIKWYDSPTGGTFLGIGTTFNTPSISSTTAYYAETVKASPNYHVGPLNTSIGAGSTSTNTTRTTIFNCLQPSILVSILVNAGTAGNRTFVLKNSGGTVLQSATVNLPVGNSIVPLNFPIPVGNGLQIGLGTGSTANLFRNTTGATYPYTNGAISITGNNNNSTVAYYYYYDWVIASLPCVSTRTAATAYVGSGSGPVAALVTPTNPAVVCAPNALTLAATTGVGYTYQWFLNGGAISGATSSTYSATSTGNYHVQISPANFLCQTTGTSNVVNVMVSNSPTATITPSGNQFICPGNTITLSVTSAPGNTYQWYNGATLIGGATNSSYTTGTAGDYSVIVTNTSGCSSTSSTTSVALTNAPIATISPAGSATFCTGNSLTITASTGAGYTYQWLLNNSPISGANSSTYNATSAGTYSVIESISGNCPDTSLTLNVSVITGPGATITPSGPLTFCQGGSVTLSANTGTGLTYQWYNGTTPISGALSSSYTANQTGSYSVVITNGNGCSSTSSSINVIVNTLPLSTITPSGSISFCDGSSLNLLANAGAGFTYQWHDASGPISGAVLNSYTVTAAGNYLVVVTDVNGCTSLSSATTVTSNAVPVATITPASSLSFCVGGSVVLQATTGSVMGYQWYINGTLITGANSINYTATGAGDYTVIVTNSSLCSDTSAITTVVINPLPIAVITVNNATICEGDSTLINANIQTGYNYVWYYNSSVITGATSSSYFAKQAGNYYVIITDVNGCSNMSNTIPITVVAAPTPTIINTSGVFSVSGGPYSSYQWFNAGGPIAGETNPTFTPTANGIYSVEVMLNGCRGSASFNFTTLGLGTFNETNITVSPNPFNNIVEISGIKPSLIKLVDIAGKTVASSKNKSSLSVEHVAKGMYMIQVFDQYNKMVLINKIIKN